eukprot:459101_1
MVVYCYVKSYMEVAVDGGDYKVYSGCSYGERYAGSGAGGGYGACIVCSYDGGSGGGRGHSYDGHDGYCGYDIVEEHIVNLVEGYHKRGEGTYRKAGDEGTSGESGEGTSGEGTSGEGTSGESDEGRNKW